MNFPSSLLRSFIEISILSAALSYCVKVKIITGRNHRRCFVKEGVLKKFANFTKKTPVLESLVHKVAGLKACNFIKKRPQHMSSLVKFVNFLRTPIVKDIRERLLLHQVSNADVITIDIYRGFVLYRSSRLQMFFKIGVFKNFANLTGKHLCKSICLIKLQA